MSEREFELYLSVLGRLLRLTPAQRDAIADELRDDLESRFEDLCREGMDREAAIQKAIEELGDASGLADHFSTIAKERRRRFVFRLSMASALVLAVGIALSRMFFAPAPFPGPDQANAQMDLGFAQSEQGLALTAIHNARRTQQLGALLFTPDRYKNLPETIELFPSAPCEYPEALHAVINVNFDDAPLVNVVELLSKETGLAVFVDRQALADEGSEVGDLRVTVQRSLPAYEILNHVSRGCEALAELTWAMRDDTVWFTTKTAAMDIGEAPYSRVISWDLAELTAVMEPDVVSDVLQWMTTDKYPWEDFDGEGGALQFYGSTLNVHHVAGAQRDVGFLLEALAKHASAKPPARTAFSSFAELSEEVRERLSRPIDMKLEETPLGEVVDYLNTTHNVPVLIDAQSLFDLGLPRDEPVSFACKEMPLFRALEWMLEPLDLTVDVQHQSLWVRCIDDVTTSFVIYDVRELAPEPVQGQQLVEAIQSTVSALWIDVDGDGGHVMYVDPGILVVLQTSPAHREIEKLIAFHRDAEKRQSALALTYDPDALETRMYRLNEWFNYKKKSELKPTTQEIEEALRQFVASDSWEQSQAGGRGTLRWLDRTLIIKQTRDVHRQVSQFLIRTKMGGPVGDPNSGGLGGEGGMGGGGLGGGGMGGGGMGGGGAGFF